MINYKTAALTIAAARSVIEEIENLPQNLTARLVIIDNASNDGSAEQIEDWINEQTPKDHVKLVQSDANTGFSGGHNQGMLNGAANFFLILNSDALLRRGFLMAALETAKTAPSAGIVAPQLEYQDGTVQISKFRFFSPISEFIRGSETGMITNLFKRWDVPLGIEPKNSCIDWVSFACVLLRGRMVEEIGLMDDGYFLYFEDAEYCLRAKRAGWSIVQSDARAVHFRGGSGPVKKLQSEKKRMPKYYYASRTRFLYQAYGRVGLLAANVLWLVGRAVATSRRFFGKAVPPTNHKEFQDIWINFQKPLGPSLAPRPEVRSAARERG